jgi:hypothetical protein
LARELVAVHARHADVADDEVGDHLGDAHERLGAAAGRHHVEPLAAQAGRDGAQQVRLVVNHE